MIRLNLWSTRALVVRTTAGAIGARLSLRPLFSGRVRLRKPRTHRAARMRTHIRSLFEILNRNPQPVIARSACDEAIHASASGEMGCFAEPVIGRAFARPVGSQ